MGKKLGGDGRRARWLERRFGHDDEDFSIPLLVDGRPEELRLRGVIDRVDEIDGRMLVVDYKSGSSPISLDDLCEGVNVQMLVYLRAAAQLLAPSEPDKGLAGGLFLHLRGNRGSSGWIPYDGKGEEAMRAAESRIAENIAAARRGDFRVEPRRPDGNGRCTRYCEFSQLCRVKDTQSPAPEFDE